MSRPGKSNVGVGKAWVEKGLSLMQMHLEDFQEVRDWDGLGSTLRNLGKLMVDSNKKPFTVMCSISLLGSFCEFLGYKLLDTTSSNSLL
jgi:hypothetical protein